MYLTITSTAEHAADLGYLLHKHPDRVQRFDLPVGVAHVFYPEATEQRCTAALLLEVDPIGLVRNRRFRGDAFALGQYVNDRPYAASSMLAVALARVFRTAMSGRCTARPDLAGSPLPLEIRIPSTPTGGTGDLVRRLFTPLGWSVRAEPEPLDPQIPQWGASGYSDVRLTGRMALDAALSHLYVLLPVLDDAKHYWVSRDEVDKLVRTAGAWLPDHPERELISSRYLAHQRALVADASDRLLEHDDTPVRDSTDLDLDVPTLTPIPLAHRRRAALVTALRRAGATRVLDLGCGEGALLRELIADPAFVRVVGADVSARALERAERNLGVDRMSDHQRARLELMLASVTYRDARFAGFDAVVLSEVVEHVDLPRLSSLERTVFAHARPATVLVTTPNAEYNARYPDLGHDHRRHPDHRFEWSRAEFAAWARALCEVHPYDVLIEPVGELDAELGAPTQMAVFTRTEVAG